MCQPEAAIGGDPRPYRAARMGRPSTRGPGSAGFHVCAWPALFKNPASESGLGISDSASGRPFKCCRWLVLEPPKPGGLAGCPSGLAPPERWRIAYQIFPGMGVHLQVGGGGGGGGGVAVVPYIITTPIVIFERNMVNSGI
jgi:hypothetical protein